MKPKQSIKGDESAVAGLPVAMAYDDGRTAMALYVREALGDILGEKRANKVLSQIVEWSKSHPEKTPPVFHRDEVRWRVTDYGNAIVMMFSLRDGKRLLGSHFEKWSSR